MSSSSDSSTRRRQWLGFMLSPLAWTVYFVVVYVLNEAACKLTLLPPTAVFPAATIFTVVTLGLVGYGSRLAYRAWRYGEGEGEGNGRFLGPSGLLLGGMFGLMTVAVWAAAWVLRPC